MFRPKGVQAASNNVYNTMTLQSFILGGETPIILKKLIWEKEGDLWIICMTLYLL